MRFRYTNHHVVLALLLLTGSIATLHVLDPLEFENCSSESNASIRAVGFDPSYDPARVLDRVESITGECAKGKIRLQQAESYISGGQHQNRYIGIRKTGSMALQLYSNRTSPELDTEPLGVTETSPESDEITIRLASQERIEERELTQEAVLAHELAHATNDVNEDELRAVLDRLPDEPTTDYVLALRGIREGEAMWVMATYVERYGEREVNITRYRNTTPRSSWEQGLASVVYYYGYVHEQDRRGARTDQPVVSTRQLLHPDASMPPPMPQRDTPSQLDGNLQHVGSDRVGELVIRYSLRTNGLSLPEASEAAAGWKNGRMDYYRTGDGDEIVHWVTHWTNESEAREFTTTWRRLYDNNRSSKTDVIHVGATDYAPDFYYQVRRHGNRVTIVGAADPTLPRNTTR